MLIVKSEWWWLQLIYSSSQIAGLKVYDNSLWKRNAAVNKECEAKNLPVQSAKLRDVAIKKLDIKSKEKLTRGPIKAQIE